MQEVGQLEGNSRLYNGSTIGLRLESKDDPSLPPAGISSRFGPDMVRKIEVFGRLNKSFSNEQVLTPLYLSSISGHTRILRDPN